MTSTNAFATSMKQAAADARHAAGDVRTAAIDAHPAFSARQPGEAALIPFVTCGDPNLDLTEELVCAMAHAGADMIELGLPFSDPMAEGPVLQAANARARAAGATTEGVFEMIRRLRERCQVPLAFVAYANLVYAYGVERFVARMAELEVRTLILSDVPFEERGGFVPACEEHGVDLVSFVASASDGRVERIAGQARGFVCCVGSPGAAGGIAEAAGLAACVKAVRDIPCVIDLGVSTPEELRAALQASTHGATNGEGSAAGLLDGEIDGVVIGEAAVRLCAQHGQDCIPFVADCIRGMKRALSA